jgi:hypothetical protein
MSADTIIGRHRRTRALEWCEPIVFPRRSMHDVLYARCSSLWRQPSVNLSNSLTRVLAVARERSACK